MTSSTFTRTAVTVSSALLLTTLMACNIHVQKDEKGGEKKVDITTPLGNLNVRNDNVQVRDTGLAEYPGATMKPTEKHNDSKANVNIDTPFFGLKVVALTYLTNDSPDKVLAFYRDKMKSFGPYVECKGRSHNNDDVHNKDDLNKPVSCDDKDMNGPDADLKYNSPQSIELKAGTRGNQHIVAVKPKDSGSEFSLVYVKVRGGKEDTI